MTKKDYIKFAEVFRLNLESVKHNEEQQVAIARVVDDIALVLSEDNLRFNHSKFLTACGIKVN